MFNFTPSWNWKEVPIMIVLRVILERILKAHLDWFSSLMKSQNNFRKLTIKYKMVETFLALYIWDTEYLVHCPFVVLQGLREEKNGEVLPDWKYIAIHQSISNQSEKPYQDWEYGVLQESLVMKWIWKVCCI